MDSKTAAALVKECKAEDDWSAAWAQLAGFASTFGEGWDNEAGPRVVITEMAKALGTTKAKAVRGVVNLAGYVPPRASGEDGHDLPEHHGGEETEAGDDAPTGGESYDETSDRESGEGGSESDSQSEQDASSDGAGESSGSDGAPESSDGADGDDSGESDSESDAESEAEQDGEAEAEQSDEDILRDLLGDDESESESEQQDGESDPEQQDAEDNHGQGGSESEGEGDGDDDSPVLAFTGPKASLNELLDLASAWPDVRPLTPEDWQKVLGGGEDALPETIPGPVDDNGKPVRDLIADIAACWGGDPEDVLVPYLWGPPGAGKTYSMRAAAERMGLPSAEVEMGRMTTELDVKGFINGYGVVRTTPREIVEHGGVLIVNEGDNANADVWIALNGLIEAIPGVSQYVFPDGPVTVHKDFRIGITGNTNGRGGTIGFESREALDLSSLDRMTYFEVGYDRKHDENLCGTASYLVDALWMLREAGEKLRLDHVFTPRAIIKARKSLKKQRWTWEQILNQCYLTHCGEDDVAALRRAAPKVWSLAK